ncbi:glycolate oxidase subunit GlcF [Ectothiorhodospiraceae bacterium 2226]|nr:glycolate oxidase subunit GlcF [Ectothiorhodospiraceae bacterium 2226]
MQTRLADFIKDTPKGKEAEAILRACVHCGFCTATCPTYQLLGDELDGPRGRIYLIKQALEGEAVSERTQRHLDRCLTCRACETTCPSGVRYARLLDIGREVVEARVPRPLGTRIKRTLLRRLLPRRRLVASGLTLGRWLRPWLPTRMRAKVPAAPAAGRAADWPSAVHARKVVLLEGCVQPALAPNIDAAAARVLDRLGISVVRAGAGCCGALSHHLSAEEAALAYARANIDAWWPHIEAGAEAVLVTASGCGVMVKDYGTLLRHDIAYAAKAQRISELLRDPGELIGAEAVAGLALRPGPRPRVAFQAPCTLQHGLRRAAEVEAALRAAGFALTPVPDSHLCCGSAGTYSLLQPTLAERLRADKLAALRSGEPEVIATANIGCLTHLAAATELPVRHWLELLDEQLA